MFQRVLGDFSAAQVIAFDRSVSSVFEDLTIRRVRLATLDLRIGATGLAYDLTVLTRNLRDFRQIPGLRVEDWTA
jgi:tRNA(fMet)-specific endonuclease VapC